MFLLLKIQVNFKGFCIIYSICIMCIFKLRINETFKLYIVGAVYAETVTTAAGCGCACVVVITVVSGPSPDMAMKATPHKMLHIHPRKKIQQVRSCAAPTKKLTQKVATLSTLSAPTFVHGANTQNPATMVPKPGTKIFKIRQMTASHTGI